MKLPTCPDCGRPLVPIGYGQPTYEAFQQSKRGEVALGGCIVSEYDPALVCHECRRYFDQDAGPYRGLTDPLELRSRSGSG